MRIVCDCIKNEKKKIIIIEEGLGIGKFVFVVNFFVKICNMNFNC